MCQGGRLLADFVAGTRDQPNVPELAGNLTHTVEGEWVVWAYKLARPHGDEFLPLTGRGGPYPANARGRVFSSCPKDAQVRIPAAMLCTAARSAAMESRHSAPDPACSCGFHALSDLSALNSMAGPFSRRGSWAGLAVPGRGVVRPGAGLRVAGRPGYSPVPRRSADSCKGGRLASDEAGPGPALDSGTNPGRFDPEPGPVAKGTRRPRRPAGPSPLRPAFRKWSRTAAAPLRARSGCGR